MNRPQVAYFLSGPLVYFPSGARKRDGASVLVHTDGLTARFLDG